MKKMLILLSILTSFVASAQSIEINPNGGTNASAILDLKSTTKGFLLPRMINAQMLAIPNPAQGLLAFCTDCGTNGDYYFYKGTAWVALGSTTVSVSTTVGPVRENANENGATITTGGVLNLAPANATNPGIVTAIDQTFGGVKTFSSDLTVNGLTVGKGKNGISTNTAIGNYALKSNTTGTNNTANGASALYFNTEGNFNTANGQSALIYNTTGSNNTANGAGAFFYNTTGSDNTAIGRAALDRNETGSNNTAIGKSANVTFGNLTNATAIGANAKVSASHKIQLGDENVTAVQLGTADKVTLETGYVKITGGTPGAGKVLTSDADGLASWATATSSGVDLTTAQTIAGVKTFLSAPVLSSTTASKALFTDANKNIVSNEITGSGNVVMSTSPLLVTPNLGTPSAAILTNATGLPLTNGAGVTGILPVSKGGTGSDIKNFVDLTTAEQVISALKIFDADLFVGYVYGSAQRRLYVNGPVYATGFLNTSDKRLKLNIQNSNLGLDFINKLRPVSYYRNNDESKKTEYGLIAQELEETLNSAGVTNNGIISKDGEGMYSVRYNDLIAPMIKAIQEQKTIIDNQQIQIGNQQLQIDELKKMVEIMLKK